MVLDAGCPIRMKCQESRNENQASAQLLIEIIFHNNQNLFIII